MMLVASKIAPAAGLSEVITGLIAVCSIYVAGNAVVRWKAGQVEQAKNVLDATAKSEAVVAEAKVAERAEDKADGKQVIEAVDDQRG